MSSSALRLHAPPGDATSQHKGSGPLRILALCDYYSPDQGGGVERVAHEVYRRLVQRGCQITVVTTARRGARWPDEPDGVRVVEVPSIDLTARLGAQICLTRGARVAALEVANEIRPHVLHANSLQFQTSVAAARLHRTTGIPLVLTAHLGGFKHLAPVWRALGWAHERTIGRYVLSQSQRVIAVSQAVADHLVGVPGMQERLRIIPNGVDHRVFHPPSVRSLRGEIHLLFVGRLIANKGPGLLLEAIGILRHQGLPVRLSVAGDGPQGRMLQRRAAGLGISDRVRFIGRSDRVAGLLQDADVFVRPTYTEGMPLAVLEAMASGVCIVASDVGGNRSLISHGENGLLFRTGDAEDLAAALRTVVTDEGERARLAQAGLRTSRTYSWERCATETLRVLQEAAELARPRSRR